MDNPVSSLFLMIVKKCGLEKSGVAWGPFSLSGSFQEHLLTCAARITYGQEKLFFLIPPF